MFTPWRRQFYEPGDCGAYRGTKRYVVVAHSTDILVFLSSRKLKVTHGVVLIAFYLVFTCYVFGRAYGLEWTDGIAEIFQSLFLN